MIISKTKIKNILIIITLIIIFNSVFVLAFDNKNEKGLSLNFKNIELNEVFKILGERTLMNIVTTENVEGEIDLFLNSVSFFEAIDIITLRTNLDYIIKHNTIIVGNKEEIKELKEKDEKRFTKIYFLENIKPSLVEENIKHLINEKDTIQANEKERNILVSTNEKNLKEVETIVNNLDKAKRQVAIKVRFEEISHSDAKKLGIDWSKLSFDADVKGLLNIGEVSLGHEIIFDRLKEEGVTKTLANPRLTTLEGEKASINIGDRIPVITSRSFNEDGKEEVKVEYQDLGIDLSLTPKITSNNNVLIDLKPEVTNFIDWIEVGGDKYPEISVKELETKIEIKDGETIAIGGLIQHTTRKRDLKIPLLNKIPKLGNWFFSYEFESKDKRELIIFVTPEIINNNSYHFDGKDIVKTNKHIYTVQKGDTFVKIGNLFNVPFIKIMELNKHISIKNLNVGMDINIPIPENKFYEVEKNDNYKKIAQKKNVDLYRLKKMNNFIDLKKGMNIVY